MKKWFGRWRILANCNYFKYDVLLKSINILTIKFNDRVQKHRPHTQIHILALNPSMKVGSDRRGCVRRDMVVYCLSCTLLKERAKEQNKHKKYLKFTNWSCDVNIYPLDYLNSTTSRQGVDILVLSVCCCKYFLTGRRRGGSVSLQGPSEILLSERKPARGFSLVEKWRYAKFPLPRPPC